MGAPTFTAGPWKLAPSSAGWRIDGNDGRSTVVVLDRLGWAPDGQLLAAGPELYAALTDVIRIAKAASIGVTGNAPRIAKAEAALAKARGDQP